MKIFPLRFNFHTGGELLPTDKGGKIYFSALDGFRYFAAIVVLLHHIGECVYFTGEKKSIFLLIQLGHLAINFFFILSGFVTAASIQGKTWDFGYTVNYFATRLIRIFPPHLLVLFFSLVILVPPVRLDTLFANIFLIQSWIPSADFYYSYNSIAWYLSSLLGIYLFVPVFVRYFKTCFVLSILVPVILSFFVISRDFEGFLYIHPFSNMFKFLSGMLVYQFVMYILQKHPQGSTDRMQFIIWSVLEIFVTGFLIFFAVKRLLPFVSWLERYLDNGLCFWIRKNFLTVFLFWFFVVFAMEKGILSRLLSTKCARWLGRVSFCVFLLHLPIRDFIIERGLFFRVPMQLREMAYIVVCTLLAFPMEYCVNSVMTQFLNSLWKKYSGNWQIIKKYGVLFLTILICFLYLCCAVPRRVNFSQYLVSTMSYECDNVLPDQIIKFASNDMLQIHPGLKPTSVTFHLNKTIKDFSCQLECHHEMADVIVNFYLDKKLIKQTRVRGKYNVIDVAFTCAGAEKLVVEVDKNGKMSYDGTLMKSMCFRMERP